MKSNFKLISINLIIIPQLDKELPIIWKEVIYYIFSLIFIEWMAYVTAKNNGLNTNKFRGGKESEKYVRGSLFTIRKSQIELK